MKERPILFSAPMVRAILNGSKTQTRRVVKVQGTRCEPELMPDGKTIGWRINVPHAHGSTHVVTSPYGAAGDRLWVKESWRACEEANGTKPRDMTAAYRVWHEADTPHQLGFGKLRPSIFMPRWASRITLEVTDVRVERLQSISEADAMAESPDRMQKIGPRKWIARPEYRSAFRETWNLIHGAGSWNANPWVWVVEFRKVP